MKPKQRRIRNHEQRTRIRFSVWLNYPGNCSCRVTYQLIGRALTQEHTHTKTQTSKFFFPNKYSYIKFNVVIFIFMYICIFVKNFYSLIKIKFCEFVFFFFSLVHNVWCLDIYNVYG